jgi:hypothetical protein
MTVEVLATSDIEQWRQVMQRCVPHDVFHRPECHVLAEEHGEGVARLFCYSEGEFTIALPLLLRSLDDLPFAKLHERSWRDATSVYGYPGPVGSHPEIPSAVIRRFQSALTLWLKDERVISVFSRLNTFLRQTCLLEGLGECRVMGRTVSIDLTQPTDVQRAGYRKNHKERINRLRRLGVRFVDDRDRTYLPDFVDIYTQTMQRVGATPSYYFSLDYFRRFFELMGDHANLFVALHHQKPVCAGLFLECQGIVQYHLSGTAGDALKLAPMKLLIDEARLWANGRGAREFHLGGGTSLDPADSLFHFKLGFSDRTHDFLGWRWIVAPDVYARFQDQATAWNARCLLRATNNGYFPAYRCPTVTASTMLASVEATAFQPSASLCGGEP